MATAAAIIAQTGVFAPEFAAMVTAQGIMATDLTAIAALQATAQAEEIAAGLIITGLQVILQQKYIDLASNYYDLYAGQRDFYYNNFQDGGSDSAFTERGLLAQVFNIPVYTPQYLPQANNVSNYAPFAFSQDWWDFHGNMYSTPAYRAGLDGTGSASTIGEPEQLELAAIVSDYSTYLYRYEEHRKDVYDERTWEWQNQSLNYGVKQANLAQSGLATSFPFLDHSIETMADWMSTQANGIMRASGYKASLVSNSQKLYASSLHGRNLAMSVNLGNDIRTQNYYKTQYGARDNSINVMPSMFIDEEESMTQQSLYN